MSAIAKVGPRNIAELSRITGAHQETIRYKIKNRFGRRGFKVHAQMDYPKVGLTVHWGSFHFTRAHRDKASQLLRLLNKTGYLIYYGKVLPSGRYVAVIVLPEGKREQYETFLSWLQSKGVFSDFELNEALTHHHFNMNPRFFNFKLGRWEMNWNEVKASPARLYPLNQRTDVHTEDYDDLLLLKELQKDALQHITMISRQVKVNQKTLEYHYRNHIVKRKMILMYWVRWAQDTSEALLHTIAMTRLSFRMLSKEEFKRVQMVVSRIPFLWMDDLLSNQTYVASMYLPFTEMIPMLGYLNSELPDLGSRMSMEFVKFNEAISFTVPYEMWKDGEWVFDIKQMKAAVEKEYLSAIGR